MNITRKRRIVSLAISYFGMVGGDLETLYPGPSVHETNLLGDDKIVFVPQNHELESIEKGGKDGNRRTAEVLELLLTWLENNLDGAIADHPYYGDGTEHHAETCITVGDESFKTPTTEEIEELLANSDLRKAFPPLRVCDGQIGWDIYGPNDESDDEWLDTVFYDRDCDRDYVRRSLISHDGFPDNIRIMPKLGTET